MVKSARTGKARAGPSSSKSNASGYAQRQARKEKSLDEVYEFKQDAVRRSKVTQELGRDEAMEFGDESEDDDPRQEKRARLVGENGEDERIASEDDEDIDSDAAFEEEDDERFAGFNFSGKKPTKKAPSKKKPAVHFADVNLDEDDEMNEPASEAESEESEESGEDDEFIDLLDILDGKGEVDNESDSAPTPRLPRSSKAAKGQSEDEDEEEDSEEEEGESSESDEDEDMEDAAPEALDQLESFITNLDPSKKRKAPADEDAGVSKAEVRSRKRRMIKERTEAGVENEFRAQASGSKLRLDDLLAPLGSQSSNLLSLKKSTKSLAPGSSSTTLTAPLPQRTQERLDREAAYEQTKEEVDKWKATMKRIKEAEHLSFPLQAEPTGRASNLELSAKFKPTTALESNIDKLLKSAKMREEDMAQTEDLKMNHLTVEEVNERRGELRKMRELMFRAEVKAKRVAKIKSKTYRRIQKKGREKAKQAGMDDEGGDDENEGDRLKREVARARERATLRHKNTGKWAKSMKGRELDVDERREISAMLDRGDKLRRRIQGKGDDEDEDQDDDSESDEDEGGADVGEDGVMRIRASAFDELERVNARDAETAADAEALSGKSKSIFAMKFMQDAMAREQRQTDGVVDDFVKEMGGGAGNLNSDGEEEECIDSPEESGLAVQRTGGRVVYRPGLVSGSIMARPMGSLASDTSSVTLRSTDPRGSPPMETISRASTSILPESSNPWLVLTGSNKAPQKKNEIVVNKDSATLDKSKNKLKKRGKKGETEKAKAKDDEVVEISMSNVMTLEPEDDDEGEAQEKALSKAKGKGPRAFEQRDLVALAFAGDNVVQDFEAAKRREIAADAPRQVDTTLPGWGSWGGTGTRKQASKPHLIKNIKGVDPKSRSDFNKSHIIISEKRDKKAAKYMVKDLPYPYTSQAQFERSMDTPLGTEWNTRVAFQRATLPKVVKKMGAIIDPLEKVL